MFLIIIKALLYFLYCEIKLIVIYFKYLFNFFKYIIHKEKNFLISRDNLEKRVLKKNYEFWKKFNQESISENDLESNILITCLVSIKSYCINNTIIGLYLAKILKKNPIALIKKYDFRTERFMRSFGIKKFYYIDDGNFFLRLKYFFQAISLIGSIKKTDDFLNLRYEQIYIGKIVYDHFVRYTRIASVDKITPKFYFFLSRTLLVHDFIKKIFKENRFKEMVQSENQFIPSSIVFQNALINKCQVYTSIGINNISVRIFDNFKDCYINRYRFTNELFEKVFNNQKEIAVRKGEKIITNRFLGIAGYSVDHDIEEDINYVIKRQNLPKKINDFTKKEICKKFDWDENMPIIMIFAIDLTDGLYTDSWRLFRDNLTWMKSTLNIIKDFRHINWLIKPHPNDEKNKVITDTQKEVKKLSTKYKNISLFPSNFGQKEIPKIISAAVTANGTPGYEYPSLGIPTIICGESLYSGHGFNHDPKTKQEYYDLLKNADKLTTLSKDETDRAKTFIYIYSILARVNTPLVPKEKIEGTSDKEFWKDLDERLENYDSQKDDLIKNFKIQLEKKDTHTINYNQLIGDIKIF